MVDCVYGCFKKITSLVRKLLAVGVVKSTPLGLRRNITLTNALAVTFLMIIALYALIYSALDATIMVTLVLLVAPFYAAVLIANYFSYYDASRFLIVLCGGIYTTLLSIAMGPKAGAEAIYLVLVCFPALLFRPNEKPLIAFSILFPFSLYLFLIFKGFSLGPWVAVPESQLFYIKMHFHISTAIIVFSILGYFYLSVEDSDSELLQNIENLNREIEIRKRTEAVAHANMTKLNTILDSASDAIVIVNRDYRFIIVNKAAEKHMGDATEALGKTVQEIMGDHLGSYYSKIHETVFRTAKTVVLERPSVLLKNAGQYYSTVFSPVFDSDGQVNEIIAITRDITEIKNSEFALRKAKEAADSANLSKNEFLATMSHEIRTPLGVIVGYAEMMSRSSNIPPEMAKATDAIVRNSQHLMQLIEDILDLSKIEAGHLNIMVLPVRLEEQIQRVVALLGRPAQLKGIHIQTHLPEQLPININSDPLRIRQILLNLIGNAIKFSDKGTIQLNVSLEKSAETRSGRLIKISVKDEGIGITAEQQKLLFQPFSQVHTHDNQRPKGTGLGLYLAKRLAQALGGDVTLVAGKESCGSEFLVTIDPDLEQQNPDVRNTLKAEPSSPHFDTALALQNVRILLVEDNPDAQFLMQTLLEMSGATVLTAGDGEQAVNMALDTTPDVVLMDIQLPVFDGITAVNKLRAQGFKKPIIALTANALLTERRRCLEAGCDDYLTKPVDQPLLIKTIQDYLG